MPVLLLLATLALSVGLNGYLLVAAGEDNGRVREVHDGAPAGLHAELVRTRAALRACQTDSVVVGVGVGDGDGDGGDNQPGAFGPAAAPAPAATGNSFVTSSQ